MCKKFGNLEFDNFDKNKNIKNLIDPQSFKDLNALYSFIKEALDVRANHTAQSNFGLASVIEVVYMYTGADPRGGPP